MKGKSAQLQIRVTAKEKTALSRAAHRANLSLSEYVLSQALPPPALRFEQLVKELAGAAEPRFVLAELSEFLTQSTAGEFGAAVAQGDSHALTPYLANYLAAMVEVRAHQLRVAPPMWVTKIPPMTAPVFVGGLEGLRFYLLTATPPPFRRRGIFIDATVGNQC